MVNPSARWRSWRPPQLKLRTRLTLSVVLIALVSTLGVAAVAFFYVKANTLDVITNDQMQRTAAIADAIDQKFISRRVVLQTFADSLQAQQLRGTAQPQALLLRHPSLREVFDNVTLIDRTGVVVASYVEPEAVGRTNVADRPYFIETLSSGRGVISQPLRNRTSGQPQVLMTQPVHDERGNIIYVINGQITLDQPHFLGELASLKFGKSGYVFITNTNGIIIDSPRKSRILKHIDADGGHDEAITRAVAGFEGSAEAVNRQGVHVLYAFKQTRQTNWIIGTHYPYQEAFADLRRLQRLTWMGAIALSLLVGGLSLALLRRQLAPLGRLHQHMLATHAAAQYVPSEAAHAADELGELGRTFDRLMAERQSAREQLEASENYLREILRHAGDGFIAIDRDARIMEWNRQAELIFGYSREEALGQQLAQMMVPETLRSDWQTEILKLSQLGTSRLVGKRTEITAWHRDGHPIPVELSIGTLNMGDHFVAHAFLRDISERRAAEDRIAASRKLLQDIADNIPSLVARLDSALRYTFVNALTQKAYPDTDIIGKSMQEVYEEDEFLHLEPWARRALSGERVVFEKAGARHSCYAAQRFEITYVPDIDPDGRVQGFYSMSFDITERKRIENAIAANEAKLRGITDNLPALVAHLDTNERFSFVNAEVREWWGKEPASLIGHTMREVVGEMFYARIEVMLKRALAGERLEFEVRRIVDGALRDAHSIFVPEFDTEGVVVGVFAMTTDITELKSVQRKLAQQARVDSLTSLANRMAFNEALPLMLARAKRSGDALAVMYLDIDHFKAINDSLGHAAGDEVLCEFARRLQASVRTTDLVVRLAGDEFVVVLENVSGPDVARAVAEKIVIQVSQPLFHVNDKPLSITTSIGIVFHSHSSPPTTPSELLARADGALYAAKAAGRNRFEFAP